MVILGDAAQPDVLDRMGLDTALAVVVTMNSSEATEAVVVTARSLAPGLGIVARSRDAQQAGRLYQLGASDVVPETIEASLRLSEALLSRIGMPPDAVVASIRQRRDEFGTRRAMPKLPIGKADALRDVDFVRKTAPDGRRRAGGEKVGAAGHRVWRAPPEGVKLGGIDAGNRRAALRRRQLNVTIEQHATRWLAPRYLDLSETVEFNSGAPRGRESRP